MFNNKKLIWIILLILTLGAGATYGYFQWFALDTASTEPTTTMQTARVRQGDLVLYASGTGTLIPAAEASFGFDSSGKVVEILVQVGEQVEAGQVLAKLDDTSAQIAYAQAKRSYAEATSLSTIAAAEKQVSDAEVEVAETRSTLALLISPAVLTWEERLDDAQQQLTQAETEGDAEKITTAKQLLIISETNLSYAQKNYDQYLLENFVDTETNPRTGVEKIVKDEDGNPIIYAPTAASIAAARADYAVAKAALQESSWYLSALRGEEMPENATGVDLSKLENARIALEEAQANLDAMQLIAPISGTVMVLDFNVGDKVNSSSSLVTIADLSTPTLEIFLDETDWDKIAVGYPVEVTFDAIEEKVYSGSVTQVDPGLSTQQNTSYVRALVALDPLQAGLNLPIGADAAVDVIGGRAENALLVPVDALRETSPGEYAVFVIENDKPKLRVIKIGLKDLFYAEVLSGLEPGEVVSTGLVETE